MNKLKLLFGLIVCLILSGCPIDGDTGTLGRAGINCWDVNKNHINDDNEDINKDGEWDTKDCTSQQLSTQNPDVELNHQHFCEAFAALAQYPVGCPSDTHSTPTGTFKRVRGMYPGADGTYSVSCNDEPNNGLLSLVPKNGQYYWSLEGGYIASKTTMDITEEFSTTDGACFDLCAADAKCIASWAHSELAPDVTSYTCHLFYHSDTVADWEHVCGPDQANCAAAAGALSVDQRWGTICP